MHSNTVSLLFFSSICCTRISFCSICSFSFSFGPAWSMMPGVYFSQHITKWLLLKWSEMNTMRWPRLYYILMCKHAKIGNWLHQRFAYLFIMYFDDDDTNSIQYFPNATQRKWERSAEKSSDHLAFGPNQFTMYAVVVSHPLNVYVPYVCSFARTFTPFARISVFIDFNLFSQILARLFSHCCSSFGVFFHQKHIHLYPAGFFDHAQNSLFHGHQSNDLIEQMYCSIAWNASNISNSIYQF